MDPKIIAATSQGLIMTAASNAFAQGYRAYKTQSLSAIDVASFVQFLIFSAMMTPPNYIWQKFLEDSFPTSKPQPKKEKADDDSQKPEKQELSITNTAIKFFLDQSLGCWVNTFLFIAVMGAMKGKSVDTIIFSLKNDFWTMVTAGYKLWPMVCLLNLCVVPFDYRMLVGNTAAFAWGIYVSLFMS